MLPSLPDDPERIQPPENPSLPQPGQDRSLVNAVDELRRVLSADGTLDGDEDSLDHLREQFRSLEKEAARSGCLYEELIRLKIGGVEHDVVFDMRPANVFTTGEGLTIPVDCIPVRLPDDKREFFDQ